MRCGFDNIVAEVESVNDRGAAYGVGESFGQAGEGFVGGDTDAVFLFPFREDLKDQLGGAPVQFYAAEFVDGSGPISYFVPAEEPLTFRVAAQNTSCTVVNTSLSRARAMDRVNVTGLIYSTSRP